MKFKQFIAFQVAVGNSLSNIWKESPVPWDKHFHTPEGQYVFREMTHFADWDSNVKKNRNF